MPPIRLPVRAIAALSVLSFAGSGMAAGSAFTLTVIHRGDNGIFAVCDVDGDGRTDFLVARKPKALQWLSYPSLKSHVIAETGNIWMEIQAVDMDGDGDCDVTAPDMGRNEVAWWENPPPGKSPDKGPWKRHTIGTWESGFPHDFKVGDMDGDGNPDAVLRLQGGNLFLAYVQKPAGIWTTRRIDKAYGPGEGTALGDLDGDGDLDISDGLVWLETPGDILQGDWTRHLFNAGYGSPMTRVVIADMDGDGRNDIVVSPSDTSLALQVAWYHAANPGTGPWTGRTIMPAGRAGYIHSLQVADMDGDGHADVVTGSDHRGSREMIVYYNDDRGRGIVWREHAFKTGYGVWQAVAADVDGDGFPDILSADDDNFSEQQLWINPGGRAVLGIPGRQDRPHLKDRTGCGIRPECGKRFDALGRIHLGLESVFPEMVY